MRTEPIRSMLGENPSHGEAEDAALRTYSRTLSEIEEWYDAELAKLRSAYEARIEAADEVCQVAIRAARKEAA